MVTGMITIRPMADSDLARVVELESRSQPSPWTMTMFRGELAQPNRRYLVAETQRLIGFAGMMVIGDEGHLNTLFVMEEERRKGVATALMNQLIAESVELGVRHLTLEVRSQNEAARRFYSDFGFVPVGIRPGYYGDDDALIMWVHDVDDPTYLEGLG